jgi:Copper chaperone
MESQNKSCKFRLVCITIQKEYAMRLILFPLFFLLLFSSCAQRSQNAVTPTTQKVSFSISGMVCTSCEQSIQTKLAKIEGVKSVQASTAKQCATVEFDASKVSEKN